MFGVGYSILDFFQLVLTIFANFTLDIIYKHSKFSKTLLKKA